MPYIKSGEYQMLKRKVRAHEARQEAIAESLRIKTECDVCGYQSIDIYPNLGIRCPMDNCEYGSMEAYKR